MKLLTQLILFAFLTLSMGVVSNAQTKDSTAGYIIRHESQIGQKGPGPHNGKGTSTGFIFFDDIQDFKLSFRKRILHPGASIGLHKQTNDEVYYFTSGTGTMILDGMEINVKPGDAVLTRTGSTHETRQTGKRDLIIIIAYEK